MEELHELATFLTRCIKGVSSEDPSSVKLKYKKIIRNKCLELSTRIWKVDLV